MANDVDRAARTSLAYMAQSDGPVLRALERVWAAFQARDSQVKHATFTLQPRLASNCNSVEWDTPPLVLVLNLIDPKPGEGRIEQYTNDGQALGYRLSASEIAEWLAHLAAHSINPRPPGLTRERGPGYRSSDFTTGAGSEGFYHPRAYAMAAEGLGLEVGETAGVRGYADTKLKSGQYRMEIQALDRALAQWEPRAVRKYDRGPFSAACACGKVNNLKPKLFRASIGVMSAMGISVPGHPAPSVEPRVRCEDCGQHFAYREAPERRTSSRTPFGHLT